MSLPAATDLAADERFARQLQHAELGQASAQPVAHGTQAHISSVDPCGTQAVVQPIVQGVPVTRMLQQPSSFDAQGGVRQLPQVTVAADIRAPDEIMVMNFRMAIMWFSLLDIVTTSLSVTHEILWVHQHEIHVIALPQSQQMLAFSTIILLVGPVCGYVGAKTLNRRLVGAYLFFCFLELARAFYLLAIFPFVLGFVHAMWLIFSLFFQAWVTKIVATFHAALGDVSLSRRQELLSAKHVHARMVYW